MACAARSLEPITPADLTRLTALARADRESLFTRKPALGRCYADRLFAVALCQGAALHYVDGRTGVKDFDVWSFYTEDPERPYPYRRRGVADFGDPRFGTTPGAPKRFTGRRVDLLGRSLRKADPNDPIGTLRRYLAGGRTHAARALAEKAVVMLEPKRLRGRIIWPEASARTAVGWVRGLGE